MRCPKCKKSEVKIVRLLDEGILSFNETQVCVNPNCPSYTDLEKVPTWIRKRKYENSKHKKLLHTNSRNLPRS